MWPPGFVGVLGLFVLWPLSSLVVPLLLLLQLCVVVWVVSLFLVWVVVLLREVALFPSLVVVVLGCLASVGVVCSSSSLFCLAPPPPVFFMLCSVCILYVCIIKKACVIYTM